MASRFQDSHSFHIPRLPSYQFRTICTATPTLLASVVSCLRPVAWEDCAKIFKCKRSDVNGIRAASYLQPVLWEFWESQDSKVDRYMRFSKCTQPGYKSWFLPHWSVCPYGSCFVHLLVFIIMQAWIQEAHVGALAPFMKIKGDLKVLVINCTSHEETTPMKDVVTRPVGTLFGGESSPPAEKGRRGYTLHTCGVNIFLRSRMTSPAPLFGDGA